MLKKLVLQDRADAPVVHLPLSRLVWVPFPTRLWTVGFGVSQAGRCITKCFVLRMDVKLGVPSAGICWWTVNIKRCVVGGGGLLWHYDYLFNGSGYSHLLVTLAWESFSPNHLANLLAVKVVVVVVIVPQKSYCCAIIFAQIVLLTSLTKLEEVPLKYH